MQNIALIVSLALMAAVAAAFVWVVAGAGRPGGDAGVIARAAHAVRGRLFWAVIVAGVIISLASLWKWPIAGHAADAARPDVVVHATAFQWRWEIDRDTVKPGELVEFELTSRDVNHGFAIYKDRRQILAQAQVMPGYVSRMQVRFEEPGDYEVLCLEYCGLAHHGMRAVIKVRAGS